MYEDNIGYVFIGIIFNNVLSFACLEIRGCSKGMAPLINILINVPINYILKKWIFEELSGLFVFLLLYISM